MQITDLVQSLRRRYNAPDRPSQDWMDARLDLVCPVFRDISSLRDSSESYLDVTRTYVAAMTDEELYAARQIYAALSGSLLNLALQAYDRMHCQMDTDDVLGLSWAAYLCCLSTYDRDKGVKLITWIYTDLRSHIDRLVAAMSTRTERQTERRRKVLAAENALTARTGHATSSQIARYVQGHDAFATSLESTRKMVEEAYCYHDTSLNETCSEHSTTERIELLQSTLPAPDATVSHAHVDLLELGRHYARQTGSERVWQILMGQGEDA